MNIPTLPTDNFYKFISLSGLTLIIAGVLIFNTGYEPINVEISKIQMENVKIESEISNLNEEIEGTNKEREYLAELLNKYDSIPAEILSRKEYLNKLELIQKDKNYREYLEFIFRNKNNLIPEIEIQQQIKKKENENRVNFQKLEYNNNLLEVRLNILKREFAALITQAILSGLMIIIGIKLAKDGFAKWYKLVQEPSDKKLSLEVKEMESKDKPKQN